jgi:hypothetical protein
MLSVPWWLNALLRVELFIVRAIQVFFIWRFLRKEILIMTYSTRKIASQKKNSAKKIGVYKNLTRMLIRKAKQFFHLLHAPEDKSNVLMVKKYLGRMLEINISDGKASFIVTPSIYKLCQFFNCSESDVIHALYELSQQGYAYDCDGIDKPITLRDPLAQKQESLSYPNFFQRAQQQPYRI